MGRTPVYCRLASASCLHRSVWHGRSRSAAHRAAPAPPAVHQRRVTTLPAACRTGAAPAPADSSARPRASRRNAPGSEVAASRATRRARAPDLGASSSTRVTRYRAAPGLDATTTARVRRVRRTGARRGGTVDALPSLSIYLYTLSRSRRSNMQPARDHLNSITVVCASPRRAAPLRLHRPHVARVYRTTGDHRTHYLIKSRSEPKRPPRG